MNQFTNLTAMLIKAMFKEDTPNIPDGKFPEGSEPAIVLARMRELVAEKRINTAENMLFDQFNKQKPYYVRIGLEFYHRVSLLSDKELEQAEFSPDEIGDGIKDMFEFYGVRMRKGPPPKEVADKAVTIPLRSAPKAGAMLGANEPAPNVLADRKPNK